MKLEFELRLPLFKDQGHYVVLSLFQLTEQERPMTLTGFS